jgi:enoyl-CoA hydratase/carnithine racemase
MEKQLIEEISDGIATLRFNRPDLNALLTPIVEGLLEALPRLARDAAVGVALTRRARRSPGCPNQR